MEFRLKNGEPLLLTQSGLTLDIGASLIKSKDSHAVQTDTFIEKVVGNSTTMATENPKKSASVTNVKGNSVAWNQLTDVISFSNSTTDSRTYFVCNIMVRLLNGNFESVDWQGIEEPTHYSFVGQLPANMDRFVFKHSGSQADIPIIDTIKTSLSSHYIYLKADVKSCNPSVAGGLALDNIQLFDLTLLGIDNLTTVAEVEEWLEKNIGKQDYYPYCEGKLLSYEGTGISTVGFNIWDEEWEVGGLGSHGEDIDGYYNCIRSIGFDRINPSTTYYFKCPYTAALAIFDNNKNFLYFIWDINITFVTPSNAAYFRFGTGAGMGSTYNHDICINVSDPARNGTYEPYKKNTYDFDVKKIYGKLNGTGDYVQIFPDGMKGAGSVHDELDLLKAEALVRVEINSDVFSPLGTPLTYTSCIYRDNGIDTPLAELNVEEDNYGTIKIEGTMVGGNPSSCAPTITTVDNLHKGDAQQWAKNTSVSTVIGSALGNIEALLAAI